MKFSLVISAAIIWVSIGCGVKGDPLPPDTPATLGRGRPTFKKAVKDANVVPVKRSDKNGDKDEESQE